jgi:2-polyprenyl-3-methyl-5-hydroxy-6-metoxy-1,4-benzoquinol methylase
MQLAHGSNGELRIKMPENPPYHHLAWDEARAKRFWDFSSSWEPYQDNYFSKQVGSGIVKLLTCISPLQGNVLDFACGAGYLVDHLLAAGVRCEALDFSTSSVESVNRRFHGNPLFKGARTSSGDKLPFPDDNFDWILSVEMIEHLLPEHVDSTLYELNRILKPINGFIFLTTPNAEDLERRKVYCPECGSLFHPYQHVSSFTPLSVSKLLTEHGFRTVLCNATNFTKIGKPWLPSPLDWSPRHFARCLVMAGAAIIDALKLPNRPFGGYLLRHFIGQGPHLFWLGAKK